MLGFFLIRNAKEWYVYHNKNLIKQSDSVGERKKDSLLMKFNAQCGEEKQFSLWFVSKSLLPFIFWIYCLWNQLKFNKLIFARKMTSTFYISVVLQHRNVQLFDLLDCCNLFLHSYAGFIRMASHWPLAVIWPRDWTSGWKTSQLDKWLWVEGCGDYRHGSTSPFPSIFY